MTITLVNKKRLVLLVRREYDDYDRFARYHWFIVSFICGHHWWVFVNHNPNYHLRSQQAVTDPSLRSTNSYFLLGRNSFNSISDHRDPTSSSDDYNYILPHTLTLYRSLTNHDFLPGGVNVLVVGAKDYSNFTRLENVT